MSTYIDVLKKIKEKGPLEFAKIPIDGANIVLKLVDESNETIRLLTEWRNKYWDAFPAKFHATEDGTKKWLRDQVFNKPDRILFLLVIDCHKIGHIGTYRYNETDNSAEIDNVVRGIRNGYPGLMEKVTRYLINWMFEDLKLFKVRLKVFSDNYKAINLYERCGMFTIGTIPLKRIMTEDGWRWEETKLISEEKYPDRYFSIMEITRSAYFANN